MCIIVNENNIFIHNPKCAGTSISTILKPNLEDGELKDMNEKLKIGHFGVYPLIATNLYTENMKAHLVIRDPVEWYVSLYFYVKDNYDHPYQIYATKDFKHFFYNVTNLKNNVGISAHLRTHVSRKLNNKPLFVKYESYDDLLGHIDKGEYLFNHPDLNILLSKLNIEEGLYTYFILLLLAKVNPVELFSKTKTEILNNLDKYLITNVEVYDMEDVDRLISKLGFKSSLIRSNVSHKRVLPYLSYYDKEMLEIITDRHQIISAITLNYQRCLVKSDR